MNRVTLILVLLVFIVLIQARRISRLEDMLQPRVIHGAQCRVVDSCEVP